MKGGLTRPVAISLGRNGLGYLLVLLLIACVAHGASSPAELQAGGERRPAAAGLPLTLRVSGGLAGRTETLTISGDGLATWSDERRQVTRSRPLAAPDLENLQTLLAEVTRSGTAGGGSSLQNRCPDCLEYLLTLAASPKSKRIVVQSNRLADSAYRELLGMLISIGNAFKEDSQ